MTEHFQRYRVGGAVRDRLLREAGYDLPAGDVDWVVVGATPESMVKAGYLPVGADFPVFLHPTTHEEHALARTERKTAAGYHGFQFYAAPDVTLEEDLKRRDLTVNAMAETDDGTVIDPYGGQQDLKHRTLRHVSNAFSEDPVRILRTARFAAKLPDFTVAPETLQLMQQMVENGEADTLVAERVWAEFKKGLKERRPDKMTDVLVACGLWKRLFSDVVWDDAKRGALLRAAEKKAPVAVRAVILFTNNDDTEAAVRERFTKLKTSADVMDLAVLLTRVKSSLLTADSLNERAETLDKSDVLRRPERFALGLLVIQCLETYFDAERWQKDAEKWGSVNAGAVAKAAVKEGKKNEIAQRVRAARVATLSAT